MGIEIHWDSHGVYRKFFGEVTADDIRQSIEQVHNDLRFESVRYSINDFLDATSVDLPKSVIAQAAMKTIQDSKFNTTLLMAIVAADPAALELAKFYTSPAYQPYQAAIFTTVAQAKEWIERGLT